MVKASASKSASGSPTKSAPEKSTDQAEIGHTEGRGRPKVRQGIVVSDKMTKTIIVAITRQVRHAKYGKFIRRTKKYFVHDEQEQASTGDIVEIVETRPLSKNKRWRMRRVMTRAA